MDIEEIFNRAKLFSQLSEDHKEKLIVEGNYVTVEKNEQIFREGEKGTRIYILLSGSVKLYRVTEDGREVIVRLLSGGELFGEVVLFMDETYPVSATALGESRLFTLSIASFHKMMVNEDFRNDFIAVLMKKQRYLSSRIHYLSAYDVEERFFRFLRDNYGENESYEISLSRKDIASAVGTIPETLSRLVTRLKRRGILTWEKKELTLKEGFWNDFD
jgi:CRP/FNR family transcriptional regulator